MKLNSKITISIDITMISLLEHVHKPSELLREAHRILKDDGSLFIHIPNINSVEAKIFKQYWQLLHAPWHLYHYTPNTIQLLLDKCGFKVISINYDPWPGTIINSLNYLFRKKAERFLSNRYIYLLMWITLLPFSSIEALLKSGNAMLIHAKKQGNGLE